MVVSFTALRLPNKLFVDLVGNNVMQSTNRMRLISDSMARVAGNNEKHSPKPQGQMNE